MEVISPSCSQLTYLFITYHFPLMMSHLEPDDSSDLDGYVLKTMHEEDASEERVDESCKVRHSSRLVSKKHPSSQDWLVSKNSGSSL